VETNYNKKKRNRMKKRKIWNLDTEEIGSTNISDFQSLTKQIAEQERNIYNQKENENQKRTITVDFVQQLSNNFKSLETNDSIEKTFYQVQSGTLKGIALVLQGLKSIEKKSFLIVMYKIFWINW